MTNNTLITFKEFNKSIKKMALFTLETSSEVAAGEKIRGFIKHINVNCQYNYNVNNLISENPETPAKTKAAKSFSSSVWDQLEEEKESGEKTPIEDISLRNELSKEGTVDSNIIDDNINKALKALKSPRLSCPGSSEKKARVSSRPRVPEDKASAYLDSDAMKRHASNALKIGSSKNYGDNPFRRYRSTSRSKLSRSNSHQSKEIIKENQELEEFLAIEQSWQESESHGSNAISSTITPKKEKVSSKMTNSQINIAQFHVVDQIDSRNTEGYFKPKRGTLEDVERDVNILDKNKKKSHTKGTKFGLNLHIIARDAKSAKRTNTSSEIIVSKFGATPKADVVRVIIL